MKIAVNTQLLLSGKLEGIGRFSVETLKRITHNNPHDDFLFIFDRKYDEKFLFSKNIKACKTFLPSRHPVLWYNHFECDIPRILKKYKPNVFFSPDGWTSLSAKVPKVTVMHDLNVEHYPEDMPCWTRKYYKHFNPKFAKASDHIITVSEFSKNDIIEKYKVNPEKISVAYNGITEGFSPINEKEQQKVREKYAKGNPFFTYVGALHPRKNIPMMLKAFDYFVESSNSNFYMVIIGSKMWTYPELEKTIANMKHSNKLVFTNHLSGEELATVLASAYALTYVSKFEGFGIPIIEAMQSNVPVITSNCASMPEVAGDAALLCDPFSIESIANAMTEISENNELRNTLIEKGNIRKQLFSWDKTAEIVGNCLKKYC